MAVVLVVDDEFGIANLLEDMLADEGHTVVIASNGRQALERAAVDRPDVILTDYMMPVMDGAALINALTNDSALKGVPVILMTSVPEPIVAERCSGYTRYVRKPFKIFDLVDLVAGMIATRP